MGIIEERLAELACKERQREPHRWRACPAFGTGAGGSECMVCGAWTTRPEHAGASCPGGKEAWRELRVGDRVRVTVGVSRPERELLGQVVTIDRFTRPHGYAVCVEADGGAVQLHPEALIKEP